jgi:hypothetical protein
VIEQWVPGGPSLCELRDQAFEQLRVDAGAAIRAGRSTVDVDAVDLIGLYATMEAYRGMEPGAPRRRSATEDEDDDWPAPTEWKRGPFTLRRSNAGYGWDLVVGRRVQFRSRKATTPMWPQLRKGADENCNRALTLVAWPLGSVDVWWEPQYRTDDDGPCETCRADSRTEGCCEWCGSRPCGCDILRPDRNRQAPES